MNVLCVIRGSSSMKSAHILRMRASAAVVRFAMKCVSSSKPEMKGDTASAASGAGAPYWPQRSCNASEIWMICEAFVTRPDLIAHAFPSCGASVVVSLSLNRPTSGCQRRGTAADWIPAARLDQRLAVAESFWFCASATPRLRV